MTNLYTQEGLEQHTTKIKAGLEKAKQAGKKLGRPKSDKIKGQAGVVKSYEDNLRRGGKCTYQEIAEMVGVSRSTVQKIINKYKKSDE